MNEVTTEKKGMSKGCLVGLIVLGVLIVVIAVLGVVCYMNQDSIMKFGVNTMIAEVKTQLANSPNPAMDTTAFNAIADEFSRKMDAGEVDMQKMGSLAQVVQGIIEDKVVDSVEVMAFVDAMVDVYPELGDMVPELEMMEHGSGMMDSTMMDSSMMESDMEGMQ